MATTKTQKVIQRFTPTGDYKQDVTQLIKILQQLEEDLSNIWAVLDDHETRITTLE